MDPASFEDFFENAVVPMHWVSGEGIILHANKAELDLLGFASGEYVGRHIAEFHADPAKIEEILTRLSRNEQLRKVPARLRAKNGEIKHVLISSSVHFRDGEFVNTRCVTLDVTAEQAKRELAAIIEFSNDAIVSTDLEGVIASWNRGAQRLYGYSPEEILGKPVTMLIPPPLHEKEALILERIRRGEKLEHYETVRLRKNAELVDVSLTISPILDDAGEIIGASKIARDITERNRANIALASHRHVQAAMYQYIDRLYRADSFDDIYDAALDAISDTLHCDRASILLFDETGTPGFVAWRGISERYRRAASGHSPWTPDAADAQPIYIGDVRRAGLPKNVKASIAAENIGALAFVPLAAGRRLIGKFTIYYQDPREFTDAEIDLSLSLARQLAFSISRLRSESAHDRAQMELRRNEERLLLATRTGKIGLWDWDVANDQVAWTDSLYAIHGVEKTASPMTVEKFSALVHPDDRAPVSEAIDRALNEGAPYELEFRAVRPDGVVISLFTDAIIVRDGDRPVRMVGATMDITDRRQSDEKFRLAVETAPSGMLLVDGDGHIKTVNEYAERLFGYRREELLGQNVELLMPHRFRGRHPDYRRQYGDEPVSRPMGAGRDLYAVRRDGSEVPVEIGLSSIQTNEGLMVLASVVDISDRKKADAQRELLLAELSHRVKNTLAVVQGIARQTLKGAGAPEELRGAFEGRLGALAMGHNLLTKTNWGEVSLEHLVGDALQLQDLDKKRVSFGGPHVLLSPKQALGIAMALHELYTNAIKYGALSNQTGRITLRWSLSAGPHAELKLVWRERGGPAVSPPAHRGFGLLMIERALAQDLNGVVTMGFPKEGIVCTVEAPVAERENPPQ